MKCTARQFSDQKVCNRCGHCWDMNDPDPPKCKTDKQIKCERAIVARNMAMKELAWLGNTTKRRYESEKQFAHRVRKGLRDAT